MSTEKVLEQVAAERARQIELGWTREHDDRHRVDGLVQLAKAQIHKEDPKTEEGYYSRERLVQAAALLVAAIERFDAIDWRDQ